MAFKLLILAGTYEGRVLGERLASDPRFDVLLSYAGATATLRAPNVPHRVGGFGGIDGLANYLRIEAMDAVVDATHAFAAQMSSNAVAACARTGTPLIRLERAAWRAQANDRWIDVSDMRTAAAALGPKRRRVFLSIGKTEVSAFALAPQHDYLIRAIDHFEPGLPCARVIAARGPFEYSEEIALLERERIELIVSKNAGTSATYAKIEAARALGLPVVMVARPALPPA
ncbi:MAG TPA: cobalt-precorrin-6A reductase, partial [Polyangiales bacterium]|nr:cobalt-precorrin-6A reductase [Polyangiales bacterium]